MNKSLKQEYEDLIAFCLECAKNPVSEKAIVEPITRDVLEEIEVFSKPEHVYRLAECFRNWLNIPNPILL